MTILEKIKRCVSLVWDFQEIYGEEDIEEFCHNELSTYPQHDEIMEYFKRIENLEKNNEWHYVKDGDLPKHDCLVLLHWESAIGSNTVITYWKKGKFLQPYNRKDITVAWKEIVLPKEKLPQNCKEFGKCIYSRCPCDKFEFN